MSQRPARPGRQVKCSSLFLRLAPRKRKIREKVAITQEIENPISNRLQEWIFGEGQDTHCQIERTIQKLVGARLIRRVVINKKYEDSHVQRPQGNGQQCLQVP